METDASLRNSPTLISTAGTRAAPLLSHIEHWGIRHGSGLGDAVDEINLLCSRVHILVGAIHLHLDTSSPQPHKDILVLSELIWFDWLSA